MGFQPFALPNEVLLNALTLQFPAREAPIRALAQLLSLGTAIPRNIVLYGPSKTGKTAVTRAILGALSHVSDRTNNHIPSPPLTPSLRFAIINSLECITGRHLLERTVGEVAGAVGFRGVLGRCENLSALGVALGGLVGGRWEGDGRDGDGDDEMEGRGENGQTDREGGNEGQKQFVLVFDGIDRQRDAPPTLLPALARMGEMIPNLTTIFIVTSPRPHFLHTPGVPHLHFPPYTKLEAIKILALDVPSIDTTPSPHTNLSLSAETTNPFLSSPASPSFSRLSESETKDLYTRYLSAIWDTFAKHSGRDIVSFRSLSLRLWHDFTRPIREEPLWSGKDFPKLLVRQRSLLRGEGIMIPKIVDTGAVFARFGSVGVKSAAEASASSASALLRRPGAIPAPGPASTPATAPQTQPQTLAFARPSKTPPLPHTSLVLLVAAYLASHTPARHDSSLFSKSSALAKKRRKGGVAKPRKEKPGTGRGRRINRQLLGPQAWVVERVLSIFWALLGEANPVRRPGSGVGGFGGRGGRDGITRGIGSGGGVKSGSADILGALATLVSLRLVVKTSKVADVLDASTKFRVNVGWEVIRGVGRAVGVEVEDYVLD